MNPRFLCRSLAAVLIFVGMATFAGTSSAQFPGFPQVQGERVDADTALNRALKTSSLTFEGQPFHAVMEISSEAKDHSGRVEVWWVNGTKYRLLISSPKFSQEKVVNGGRVFEKEDGDYYPRWLENFVLALLDPIPVEKNFRGRGGAVMLGEAITNSCLRRDDRPGGITDQTTWGMICFSGSEPKISSVLTMNVSIDFKEWAKFGKKRIARTYQTDVLDFEQVTGHLAVLEELKHPDEAMFTVTAETPPNQRIATEMVSTLKEESMVEVVPPIEWPPVREGKTEGYMIVYARTDRTGQVRETAKHNSDQPGLESFGREQALRYKFKPLIVDGVAEQMEMPLVLHFSSHLDNPIPILTIEQMQMQIVDCKRVDLSAGTPIMIVEASVNEVGRLTGESSFRPGVASTATRAVESLQSCRYLPLTRNGQVTYYKGDVVVVAH